jgi:hypothetical protein
MVQLNIVLQDRTLQQAANKYANGDRERLHEMWMSGELMAIYDREEIVGHYERALANAPPFKPIDYVGELLRSLGRG